MDKKSKIFVAGGTGLVGNSIITALEKAGYKNIVASKFSRSKDDSITTRFVKIDLTDSNAVSVFFEEEKPEYVFLAAAKVGGIIANSTYRAEFIYENLQIQNCVIHQSYLSGVKKMIFLGSSCIYPKKCPQPMQENHLLTTELEYTNEPYAIAKITGVRMCESYNLQYGTNFIPVMPTNLFGDNDNFDLEKSHVLPAIIRKIHFGRMFEEGNFQAIRTDLTKNPIDGVDGNSSEAEIRAVIEKYGVEQNDNEVFVTLWGTGSPRREFLHSDSLASASVFIMEKINFMDIVRDFCGYEEITDYRNKQEIRNTHINVGAGEDISIRDLAEMIKTIVGFTGTINWDTEKPDGTFQKLLDVSRLKHYGWEDEMSFKEKVKEIYINYSNKR